MDNFLALFLGTALINNLILSQFLGLCPFIGSTQHTKTAIDMSLTTGCVLLLASWINHILYHYLLVPLDIVYLQLITSIFIIAILVQLATHLLQYFTPVIYKQFGIFLPLITTNCMIIGLCLLNTQQSYSFLETTISALGGAFGFALVMVIFASLRLKLAQKAIPQLLQQQPITLFTAGILSMSFSGFSGIYF